MPYWDMSSIRFDEIYHVIVVVFYLPLVSTQYDMYFEIIRTITSINSNSSFVNTAEYATLQIQSNVL